MSDLGAVAGRGATAGRGVVVPPLSRYPERPELRRPWLEEAAIAVEAGLLGNATRWRARRLEPIVAAVAGHGEAIARLDDAALAREARAVAALLRSHRDWPEDVIARSFALVREAAGRKLGQRHYDVQLIGAYAMVRGMVAEMATGEGKTLAATLAAATAGLAAVPVHVVTVNSYLAARDAEMTAPLYRFLGLTVGVVTEEIPAQQRAAAYRCDITYCTSKDVAFDYMRDRLRMGRRLGNLRRKAAALGAAPERLDGSLLRGLHFAIVDEADSILIDEARTPLILSGEADEDRDGTVFDQAIAEARRLRLDVHYRLVLNERRLTFLESGRQHIEHLKRLGAPWDQASERERLIGTALTALHVLNADEHYLVREGKVEIIDEYTGRIMPDRTWVEGLHEMIERKEGLELSKRRGTKSRMTYQRFFRRYCRLAGMTGTAREVAAELWRVYRLPIAAVPLHRPDRKTTLAIGAHAGMEAKWRAIAEEVAAIHEAGAPVLIGTRTVAATKTASDALSARGLAHSMLSAAHDAAEAEIVAGAGELGTITIATNMAGRGTDIRLGAGAAALGGLHVVISEPHEAGRIDRQLAGRCGRQGDPGQIRPHVSLEDDLIVRHGPRYLIAAFRLLHAAGAKPAILQPLIRVIARLAQARAERLHARMRADLLKSDEWLGDAIGFAGERE
jgi:preprotein translocase subunit SecA